MSAATEPQQARRSNRGFASMFWSLIPLTIVIVIAVIVLRPKSQPPATVDPAPDFRFASTQLGGRCVAAWVAARLARDEQRGNDDAGGRRSRGLSHRR